MLPESLPCGSLLGSHLGDAIERALGKGRNGRLDADLDGLEGAEGDVGNELGRGAGRQVEQRLVPVGGVRACQVRVELLEELVTAVLEGALGRVAEEGRAPAREDAAEALGAANLAPRLEVALVQVGVDLAAALDQVKRRHGRMCKALLSPILSSVLNAFWRK